MSMKALSAKLYGERYLSKNATVQSIQDPTYLSKGYDISTSYVHRVNIIILR